MRAKKRLGVWVCANAYNLQVPLRRSSKWSVAQLSPWFLRTENFSIVFVHGLTGDREKTWTHRSTSCFWPEKLLPADVPDARIFTYGYDADVAHFFSPASRSRIGDHAKTLLSELARARERSETARSTEILLSANEANCRIP